MSWNGYGFRPYVPVRVRQANAAKEIARLAKKSGRPASPVVIEGRKIAQSYWGMAWCKNLESYSDYANRLPRGATYVRNGSVVDLQIEPGKITSRVSGSELYRIEIEIAALAKADWAAIKKKCAGQIGSLVELLQGKLSQGVMDVVAQRNKGLFPAPREIEMKCSCPDWAGVCKHVAATMYGVGARLDSQPELLFVLRKVDHLELIDQAAAPSAPQAKKRGKNVVADSELESVFGIELAGGSNQEPDRPQVQHAAEAVGEKPAKKARKVSTPQRTAPAPTPKKTPKPSRSKLPSPDLSPSKAGRVTKAAGRKPVRKKPVRATVADRIRAADATATSEPVAAVLPKRRSKKSPDLGGG